jgi:predicted metal-dependent hydrolase
MKTAPIDKLNYTLKRSNRKSLGLTIERDGAVIVRVPLNLGDQEIEKFISEKRIWVQQKISQKASVNRETPKREYVNGQGFLYLGKSYRLRYLQGTEGAKALKTSKSQGLQLRNGYFEMDERQRHNARDHFIGWYKRKTEEKLKLRYPRYANRVGVRIKKFRISDLGKRWASYSKNGTISFNWRSVMAPIWVFDYMLVHEIVHMIEPPHSKKFWGVVSRVMPDYKEHIRWLSENGADCDL